MAVNFTVKDGAEIFCASCHEKISNDETDLEFSTLTGGKMLLHCSGCSA